MKVLRAWCACVFLLATFQRPARGSDLMADDEAVVEDENEAEVFGAEDLALDNLDDVEEVGDLCSRHSPKEVFHTVVNPHLLNIFDEMSVFVESVLGRVEAALHELLQHVDQSPIGSLGVEEVFTEMRSFVFGTMRDAYDVMREAWREVILTHARSPASPTRALAALAQVKEAQTLGEERLVGSLQEVSLTLKALLFNSIYVIQTTLQLPNNTDDHDAALAVRQTLPKVAPNFLGTLLSMILRRGSDPEGYDKIPTDLLRSVTPLVDELYSVLEVVVNNSRGHEEGHQGAAMEEFWRDATRTSHRHLEEWPVAKKNYYRIYENEEYLTEIVLKLMASF